MNTVFSILLTVIMASQQSIPNDECSEKTIYFFCHSRLIDNSSDEKQHVVVTDIFTKTVNDEQVWDMVWEWTDFVNTAYASECKRTSDLNTYRSLEEAKAYQAQWLLRDLNNTNVLVEKVAFEFETE